MTCPASESIQELKEACDYLMVPFNERTIRTNNLCKDRVEYMFINVPVPLLVIIHVASDIIAL